MGVADLELAELADLRGRAKSVKPQIDHYNIDACCEVPEELKDYARSEHMLLLTHNDPIDILPLKNIQALKGEKLWPTRCE